MFEREHHRRIASILESLDAPFLAEHACYFGGGTALALSYGEYRESIDVDFLVSTSAGYRAVRERVNGPEGVRALGRPGHLLVQAREVRTDQYGIRTLLDVQGTLIKFEIVREARITFDVAVDDDRICGVARLTTLDLATSKLLANSDRWADDSVHSRDLIDLAMMNLPRPLLRKASEKAQRAYSSIERDLGAAVEALGRRAGRLEECMSALQMTTPRALVWKRIKRLTKV
ncbi:MAG: nucleotidyl transferase AbiEii/AbiGii toxin family protein [Deltaproteobacteria bacterium]|nr:nucleotidyl transferase AbiEii/AbiGii toxin family protein [Deltaproteobacteria bacterium]